MSTRLSNSFQFLNAGQSSGVTVLKAVMSDFSYGKHAHEELAIGMTTEGVQEFSCKGSAFRSLPGDIIVFNPGEVHNGNPGSGKVLKYTMLYFDPGRFYPLAGCAMNERLKDFRISKTHFKDRVLRSLLLSLSRLACEPTSSPLEYEHGMLQIAMRVSNMMGRLQPNGVAARKDALLTRVRDYIHDNIEQNITIDDLSGVANVSRYHLIRLFRGQFGMTPHKYIINHRINRVREALRKNRSSTNVAYEFGFYDVSHMNRHFKLAFGVTPMQYKTQLHA